MRFKHTTIFIEFWGISLLQSPPHVHGQEARFLSFIHDTHISSALLCSPDGNNVYASGLYTIVVFKRQMDGTLATLQVLNNNHLGVRNIQHIIDMAIPPDGRHLYAVSASDQSLLIFGRNTSTGTIALQAVMVDSVFGERRNALPIGEDYYRLFSSPDGKHLYWFYGEHGLLAVFACSFTRGLVQR
jgi:hypothetical protein